MSLPSDILDLILSFLQEDRPALRICSQSHRILSQLAERYLYAHITLDRSGKIVSDDETLVGSKLTIILSKKPRIANYVRSLEINMTYFKPTPWDVKALLTILSSLTRITLSACRYMRLDWKKFPKSFRMGFLDSLRLSTIKAVFIIWIFGFPLSALNGANTVKDLTVEGWPFDTAPGDANWPLLESFSIKHCGVEFLELITAPTRNLRALEMSRLRDATDYANVLMLLPTSSDCLTSLNIDFGIHCTFYSLTRRFPLNFCHSFNLLFRSRRSRSASCTESQGYALHLHPLKRLQCLTLCANLKLHFCKDSDSTYALFSSIPASTCLIKTTSFLKHLTLAYHFSINRRIHIPHSLEFIDIAFVDLLNECRSTSISLCVSASCASDPDFDGTFLEAVLSALARCAEVKQLVEKGVLIIIPEKLATLSA